MKPQIFYHIYNRGNNKQKIFFNRENYLYFLRKIRKQLLPHIDIIAYCLMPNHFHFLALTKAEIEAEKFTTSLRTLLSSYTRAINLQEERTGSLFQQNTKVNPLDDDFSTSHAFILFSLYTSKSCESRVSSTDVGLGDEFISRLRWSKKGVIV